MSESLLDRIKKLKPEDSATLRVRAKEEFLKAQDEIFKEIIDTETKRLKKEYKMKDILVEFNKEVVLQNKGFKLSHTDLTSFMAKSYGYVGNEAKG